MSLINVNQNLPQYVFTLELGSCTGIYTIEYNFNPDNKVNAIPCAIKLNWDSQELNSGFKGSSTYNNDLINSGYDVVISETPSGELVLNKNQSQPTTATLTVYSPLIESSWSFELKCYCESEDSDSDSDIVDGQIGCSERVMLYGLDSIFDSDSDSNENDSDSDILDSDSDVLDSDSEEQRCRCLCKDIDSDSGLDSDSDSDSDCQCTCCEDDVCGECADKCKQEPNWDPNECVQFSPKTVYPVDDGKLPSPLPTYTEENKLTIWVPKMLQIIVSGASECELDGTYLFENALANQNSIQWSIVSTPAGACYAQLILGSVNAPGTEDSYTLNISGFKNGSFLTSSFWIGVRWRELYNDWTVAEYTINSSNSAPVDYSVSGQYSDYPGYQPGIDSPNEACQSEDGLYYDQSSCWFNFEVPDLSITVSYPNTCRQPEPCPVVGECRNEIELSSLDKTLAPCDKCYCDGGGRPLDIDVHCSGVRRPTSVDFPLEAKSYTLYFTPRGNSAVPVIDNVIYDTSKLNASFDIVKVHTSKTPEEMREWVCRYLRFATIKDYSKLKTDTENAIESNWPFNDLYWGATCDTHPIEDIPINLVPC